VNNRLTDRQRRYLARIKELACSVCDAPGPSEAHHVIQGLQYTCISLCADCHRGPSGWHGTKALWRIRKMDEMKALNITLERLAHDKSL
jgi:hypothetical protein